MRKYFKKCPPPTLANLQGAPSQGALSQDYNSSLLNSRVLSTISSILLLIHHCMLLLTFDHSGSEEIFVLFLQDKKYLTLEQVRAKAITFDWNSYTPGLFDVYQFCS